MDRDGRQRERRRRWSVERPVRAAIIAGGRRRAPGSTFHENFSCYRSLSWSRGYARGGCSFAGSWRGRDVDVERMEREWGARRGRETTEKQPQWYEKGKCGSERRCGTEGAPKRGRDAHPVRGGDKEGGEGAEGTGERERVTKEMKEKETGIDSVPRYEARRNNMRRRTASTRSRIGVAGAAPTSLSPHSGAPMAAWGTPISPTAMATPCDNGVRYSLSLKIYSNPESLFSRSSRLFFASQRKLLSPSSAMYLSRSKVYE